MIMELIIQVHLFYVICWLLKYWFSILDQGGVFCEHYVQFRCGTHTACNPKDTGGMSPRKKRLELGRDIFTSIYCRSWGCVGCY